MGQLKVRNKHSKFVNLIKVFLILVIITLGGVLFTVVNTGVSMGDDIYLRKERIGDEIYYNSETLLIIDYSAISERYTLSNGEEIHYMVVDKIND